MTDRAFWRGRRVFITGHTGFKGSWLTLWLESLGARVAGYALSPVTNPSLFDVAGVARGITSTIGDIRDEPSLTRAMQAADPEIVFHLAAQPLVRASYREPVGTFATNVMGTAHLLDAARSLAQLRAVVVVTTDKVYENKEAGDPFSEHDPLGGHDPYSASKAAVEIIAASYARAYFAEAGIPLGTARGGNVIGGGDFSADRIVPDVWRAMARGQPVELRYPKATRPWQHVLDCLAGYLSYAQALAEGKAMPPSLNFGPAPASELPVAALVDAMQKALGAKQGWVPAPGQHPREMQALALDSSRARNLLGWQERLAGAAAIDATADWYLRLQRGEDMRAVTERSIEDYVIA